MFMLTVQIESIVLRRKYFNYDIGSIFYSSCSEGIQMVVLLKFCSEGDNIPDALILADYLNEWLQITTNQVSFYLLNSRRNMVGFLVLKVQSVNDKVLLGNISTHE